MKERPILFSAPMVRAILAGTKTQTRRIVKPHRRWSSQYPILDALACAASHAAWWWDGLHKHVGVMQRCPYGQPGDRLWVRETFAHIYRDNSPPDCRWEEDVAYKADHRGLDEYAYGVWKPSIHMPRWASRINLDVTGIRVEKLQDISEADALAEGIVPVGDGNGFQLADSSHYTSSPIDSYFSLWEAINGPGSVEANPWVWVVEFTRAAR